MSVARRPWTLERIRSRCIVDPETGCHLWQGAHTKRGYGNIGLPGRTVLAHRLAYALAYGLDLADVPPLLAHLCRVKGCVNPLHLMESTALENVLDEVAAGRAWWQVATECRNGHDLTAPGAWRERPRLRGTSSSRECLACAADRVAARKVRDAARRAVEAAYRDRCVPVADISTGDPGRATGAPPSTL